MILALYRDLLNYLGGLLTALLPGIGPAGAACQQCDKNEAAAGCFGECLVVVVHLLTPVRLLALRDQSLALESKVEMNACN